MNDNLSTSSTPAGFAPDGLGEVADEREPFTPDYTPMRGRRIWRSKIRVGKGGVAEVTFAGNVPDATAAWVEPGMRSNGMNLYAEVEPTDDTATTLRLAVVPTGKRPPMNDDETQPALRLGSVGTRHVYLLSVDGTVDRAAYDAERAQRKAEREARRLAAQQAAAALYDDDEYGDDDGTDGMTLVMIPLN